MNTQLNWRAVSLTLGVVWSLYLLIISMIAIVSDGYGHNVAEFITTVYIGYSLDWLGILTGMAYAFLDGSIFGLIFSFIYNKVSQCGCIK